MKRCHFLLVGLVVTIMAPSVHAATFKSTPLPPRKIQIQQHNNAVLLTWEKPLTKKFSGFLIYRSLKSGKLGSLIKRVNKNTFSFLDSNIQKDTTYFYTIRTFRNGDKTSKNRRQLSLKILNEEITIQKQSSAFNLGELYRQKPSQADIDQIMNDFNLNWVNDSMPGEIETWPEGFLFDQTSTEPSKIVVISRLNILKHQNFSEPLPFTNLAIYDYVKSYAKNTNIHVGCNYSDNSSFLNLDFSAGRWWSRESGTCRFTQDFARYIDMLQVLVHEARHSEPGDPKHTTCGIPNGNDQYFENGSGYAYATMYLMWVYKYGTNDPPEIKELAKNDASSLLQTRFCTKPTHSNPKVQVIIDELYK